MTADLDCTYVVPSALRWDGEVIKSFVESAPYYLGGLFPEVVDRCVTLKGRPQPALVEDPVEIVARLVADLARGYRDATERLLREHASSRPPPIGDPYDQLVDARHVIPAGPGRFSYHGEFRAKLECLDGLIRSHAHGRRAIEEIYPATVPADLLRRVGYLKSFPHHAFFVAPARFDQGSLQAAQDGQNVAEGEGEAAAYLAEPADVLAPTVCHHSFHARLDRADQKTESVTALNTCHRFEAGNVRSLERLSTFRMREIVIFGDAKHVVDELDHYFEWFLTLLRQWDVSFQATTANDPFFGSSSDSKRLFQAAFAMKREVRLWIPATRRWISVASFNNHSHSLVNSFSIRGEGESAVASGCVGFGYERLLYGLYCAFGASNDAWPESLRPGG